MTTRCNTYILGVNTMIFKYPPYVTSDEPEDNGNKNLSGKYSTDLQILLSSCINFIIYPLILHNKQLEFVKEKDYKCIVRFRGGGGGLDMLKMDLNIKFCISFSIFTLISNNLNL